MSFEDVMKAMENNEVDGEFFFSGSIWYQGNWIFLTKTRQQNFQSRLSGLNIAQVLILIFIIVVYLGALLDSYVISYYKERLPDSKYKVQEVIRQDSLEYGAFVNDSDLAACLKQVRYAEESIIYELVELTLSKSLAVRPITFVFTSNIHNMLEWIMLAKQGITSHPTPLRKERIKLVYPGFPGCTFKAIINWNITNHVT